MLYIVNFEIAGYTLFHTTKGVFIACVVHISEEYDISFMACLVHTSQEEVIHSMHGSHFGENHSLYK